MSFHLLNVAQSKIDQIFLTKIVHGVIPHATILCK